MVVKSVMKAVVTDNMFVLMPLIRPRSPQNCPCRYCIQSAKPA